MTNNDEEPRIIVYAGGFQLPASGASGRRAIENARLMQSLNYRVIVLGKLSNELVPGGKSRSTIDGVECHEIRTERNGALLNEYVWSAKSVLDTIDELSTKGAVVGVIAYNYPPAALSQLIGALKRRGMWLAMECTEWYSWEGGNPLVEVLRVILSEWRMRIILPRLKNLIFTTRYLDNILGPGRNTICLPWVVNARDAKWGASTESRGSSIRPVRFVYAGSPGRQLHKESVGDVVEAFMRVAELRKDVHLSVAGITEKQYLEIIPNHRDKILEMAGVLQFCGRLSHADTVGLVRSAHYFIFARRDSRVAKVGFPTKFVEALTCGTPIVANCTGDIGLYLRHGVNGWVIDDESIDSIAKAIVEAADVPIETWKTMSESCTVDNPFDQSVHRERFAAFLEAACV